MPNLRTAIPRPIRQASGQQENTSGRRVSGVPHFMRRTSGGAGPTSDARFSSRGIPSIFNHSMARELRKSSGGNGSNAHAANADWSVGVATMGAGHANGASWAGFKERLFNRKSSGKSMHSLVEAAGGQDRDI
jgi:hypothetical protein